MNVDNQTYTLGLEMKSRPRFCSANKSLSKILHTH